ncbi:hypothetical protein AYL99_09813 [Fonsecaea erecta]|uniref:Alcohol dehydrogenase-like N-terminal domain-containing protein n=1 Tax=Fonsecaea erecta TaxID=1367422 RepID=A0A178Z847_9EURO|nr:hypothetical protein AYL99_09813 [Fonsecaea erecta]OAP55661.1 hypothetical protein AYL99_09813 [Fonsecaea erecta]
MALCPVDDFMREMDIFVKGYPAILGHDIADTVEAFGSETAAVFKRGMRVLAFAPASYHSGEPRYGGSQRFRLLEPSCLQARDETPPNSLQNATPSLQDTTIDARSPLPNTNALLKFAGNLILKWCKATGNNVRRAESTPGEAAKTTTFGIEKAATTFREPSNSFPAHTPDLLSLQRWAVLNRLNSMERTEMDKICLYKHCSRRS